MSRSNFMYHDYLHHYYSRLRRPITSVSATSIDAVDWTISEPLPVIWESICYVDSPRIRTLYSAPVFVALCYHNELDTIAISTDGVNWIFTPMIVTNSSSKPFTMFFTDDDFLSESYYSSNTVHHPTTSIVYCSPSTDTNGLFVIVTQYKVMTSTDAINWTIIDTSKCNSPDFGKWKPINFTYGRVGGRDCYIFTNIYGKTTDAYITITTDLNEWITYPLIPGLNGPAKWRDIMSSIICCGDDVCICYYPYRRHVAYFTILRDISHPPDMHVCHHYVDLRAITFGPTGSTGLNQFLMTSAGDSFVTWDGESCVKSGSTPLKMPRSICRSPMHDGSYIITCDLETFSQVVRVTTESDRPYEFETMMVGSGQTWQCACEGGGRVVILSSWKSANHGVSTASATE